MQKWEHKLVEIYNEPTGGVVTYVKENWLWEEDGRRLAGEPNAISKANELGTQGWELVAAVSAGVPVHLQYWFKRPFSESAPPPLPKL